MKKTNLTRTTGQDRILVLLTLPKTEFCISLSRLETMAKTSVFTPRWCEIWTTHDFSFALLFCNSSSVAKSATHQIPFKDPVCHIRQGLLAKSVYTAVNIICIITLLFGFRSIMILLLHIKGSCFSE